MKILVHCAISRACSGIQAPKFSTLSRQSSKHIWNMKPMKRKSDCPWTSSRKWEKQRKTTESILEHKKTTLANSDKG